MIIDFNPIYIFGWETMVSMDSEKGRIRYE